jgi:signal transduction histidine kinase
MIEYLEFIYIGLIGILLLSNIVLFVLLAFSRNKNKELSAIVFNREEIANESYIKFLNTSRDDAFDYIVEVQNKLNNFANKVEPQLNYFNTYGRVVPSPHAIMLDQIVAAYNELRTVLPEENKERK